MELFPEWSLSLCYSTQLDRGPYADVLRSHRWVSFRGDHAAVRHLLRERGVGPHGGAKTACGEEFRQNGTSIEPDEVSGGLGGSFCIKEVASCFAMVLLSVWTRRVF